MGRMQEELRRDVARLGECFAVLHSGTAQFTFKTLDIFLSSRRCHAVPVIWILPLSWFQDIRPQAFCAIPGTPLIEWCEMLPATGRQCWLN